MSLRCPYCHKRIRVPESETEVILFPCPNCGGSIDVAQIQGDDDSKVVYLSEGELIEPPPGADEGRRDTWAGQGPAPHRGHRHLSFFRWLAVMLGLIMIIPLIGGYFLLRTASKKDEAISFLNAYFSEVDHRNYPTAFKKYMASDLQRRISLEGYLKEMEGIHRTLGQLKRRDLLGWSYRSTSTTNSCTFRYRSFYRRGNAEEHYTLVKARDGWKIFDFLIEPRALNSETGMREI
jgi:hypothetical protein